MKFEAHLDPKYSRRVHNGVPYQFAMFTKGVRFQTHAVVTSLFHLTVIC